MPSRRRRDGTNSYKGKIILATILITGARAPLALEMARSFNAHGHKVIMADSMRFTVARWSNSIQRYYYLPSPVHDFINFQKKINTIIVEEKVDHFIPTCEETFYVSQCKSIPQSCKAWTSDIKLLDSLHNKLNFISLAGKYFNVPETILCNKFSDWENAADYVFKPVYSRFASTTIIAKKEKYCTVPRNNPEKWIAQKYIKGKEICVYSIWDKGILKGYTSYHSKYRAGKGAGIFFETLEHEATFQAVKKMGEDIQFTGQLCFDIILKENKPYVIECNPRGTSGAHILNLKLSDCFLKEEVIIIKKSSVFMIRLAMILTHPLVIFKKELYLGKDVLFRINDMKPSLAQLISLAEIAYKKINYNSTFLQATTEDIEWNGNYD